MSPLSSKSALAAASLSILSFLVSTTNATFAVRDAQILPRDDSPVGCYASSNGLTNQGPWTYQSIGYCKPICQKMNKAIFAMTNGDECWCGDSLPPDKTDDSSCSTGCQGFPSNICGGTGVWSVYLTGIKSADQLGAGSSSSSSSSSTTNLVTTSVAPGQTIVVTAPAAAASTSAGSTSGGGSGGGSNTAGIAAGVVVGVVAAAALVGGIIFFMRRRKRLAAEEEYRKQNQVSDFVRGGKEPKPPSSGYSQMSDQRLDPVMNRRNSVGSLADEQDYSRRILRVANPDR